VVARFAQCLGQMSSARTRSHRLTIFVLLAIATVLVTSKVARGNFRASDVLPDREIHVAYEIRLDGHHEEARVRTFLPSSDDRQTIVDESTEAGRFREHIETSGRNRTVSWSAPDVPDRATIRRTFTVRSRAVRHDVDGALVPPASYPDSVMEQLRPEAAIQVDSEEIAAVATRIGADRGPTITRLRRIHDRVRELRRRPFKGTTDALTALRLGEASCNGMSRLFVALARHVGIPARLVGGLIMSPGRKRTSHQWVEAWIGGHWVTFDPTNDHFAELPSRFLRLYYGDEVLFSHTADVNFDYAFVVSDTLVPSATARGWFPAINVWALFDRLGLSFALLRTVLMLPIGALVVVLFRNVIGVPTFGTFLPALVAAAAAQTGPFWGVVGVLVVVACVAVVRRAFARLELLHSPMLAILLAAVTTTMLATSLIAERLGIERLTYIALFPIAVLAITAERFYLSLTEKSLAVAAKELIGTLFVMLGCYVVMSSLALQVVVIGFPEILLVVIAADIYLGRWVGMRLSERIRFGRIPPAIARRA